MAKAGTVVVDVEADASRFLKDIDQAASSAGRSLMGGLGNVGKTVFGDLVSGAGAAAIGIGAIGIAAVGTAAHFNKAMSGVGAVANATAGELDGLREAALKAGADTSFSASQAADAEAELARAGVSVADITGGALIGSLGLAAAGQLDLADAATISAQAMNTFSLGGKDVGHIADVFAAGANKSAADVHQLGDALRQSGLVASQYGLSLETTVGALSAFHDKALIGSDAGTSFKAMLQRLTPQGAPAAEAMASIGFSAFDASGKFVGLADVAQQLQDGLKNLTDEQRNSALTTIFGSDAVRAATVLYGLGAKGVNDYTAAVDDQGAAAEVAAKQLDNLSGDIEVIKGSVETALIRLGDLGDDAFRGTVQGANDVVNAFNDFASSPAFDRLQERFSDLTGAGPGFEHLADTVDSFLQGIDVEDIDHLFDTIGDGAAHVHELADQFGALTGLAGGLGTSFGLMGARSLPIIGSFVPALSPITAVLGGLLVGTDKGRESLGKLAGEFKDVAQNAGPDVTRSLGEVADVAGTALAGVLDDLGPAVADAAEELLPMLADAAADLAPAIGDVVEEGGHLAAEVLPELVDLFESALPLVQLLNPTLRITASAMGLVADNAELVVPPVAALIGYLKLKALIDGSKSVGHLSDAFSSLAGTAGGLRTIGPAISDIAASRGISKLSAGMGVAKASAAEMAAGISSSISPLGALTAAAAVGVTTFTLVSSAMHNAAEEGKKAGQAFVELGDFDLDTAGFDDLQEELGRLEGRANHLRGEMDNAINPFTDNRLSGEIGVIDDTSTAIFNQTLKVNGLASMLGITSGEALDLIRSEDKLGKAFGSNAALADTLRDALNKLKPAGQNVAEATSDVEAAVDGVTESLVLNGKSFDLGTEAGRANAQALSDLSDKARGLAVSMVEQDGNIQGAKDSLLKYSDGLRTTLTQAGLTNTEIDALLTTYGLTPQQITTSVNLAGDQAAAAFVTSYQGQLDALPAEKRAEILAIVRSGGEGSVAEAKRQLDALTADRTVNIFTKIYSDPSALIPKKGSVKDLQDRLLAPDVAAEAHGAILDFFGLGGFSDPAHIAQIAPAGAMRVWAEPETGGEAYIPLSPAKRERSTAVWEETGRRLGVSDAAGDLMTMAAPSMHVVQHIKIDISELPPTASAREVSELVLEGFADKAKGDSGFLSRIGAV